MNRSVPHHCCPSNVWRGLFWPHSPCSWCISLHPSPAPEATLPTLVPQAPHCAHANREEKALLCILLSPECPCAQRSLWEELYLSPTTFVSSPWVFRYKTPRISTDLPPVPYCPLLSFPVCFYDLWFPCILAWESRQVGSVFVLATASWGVRCVWVWCPQVQERDGGDPRAEHWVDSLVFFENRRGKWQGCHFIPWELLRPLV